MIKNAKDIREGTNTLEIVRRYVHDLKRTGANWTACCPFHAEKTPSFSVSQDKNIFKCFGCGESGDGIHFLMQHRGLTYPEALRVAADISGIGIEYDNKPKDEAEIARLAAEKEKSESGYILNSLVLAFWKENGVPFSKTEEGRMDVWGRTYSAETVERFGLCVAPDANAIVKNAKLLGWSEERLLELGLVADSEKGGRYDRFRARLIFPVFANLPPHKDPTTGELRGKIAGFAGRIHPDQEGKAEKYRNSKDSILYEKSKILYGLFQTKKAISQADRAFLVEGYTDLLRMVDCGFENTVATGGTAFSPDQARLLRQYTGEVILLRDNDPPDFDKPEKENAGLKAARRDVEVAVKAGLSPKIVIIPADRNIEAEMDKLAVLVGHSVEWKDLKPEKLLQLFEQLVEAHPAHQDAILRTRHKYCFGAKEDPESFLRQHGIEAFRALLEHPELGIQDAVLWRIREEMPADRKDNGRMEKALKYAAWLISQMEAGYSRNRTIETICTAKYFNCKKTEVEEMILNAAVKQDDRTGDPRKLTPAQEKDLYRYGVFVGKDDAGLGAKFCKINNGRPLAIANFYIRPIYQVLSASAPAYKLELINEEGHSTTLSVHTDHTVEFVGFDKVIRAKGRYRFTSDCRKSDFNNIMAFVQDKLDMVYGITTLGWHTGGRFFAWQNGVTLEDGKFIASGADGRVTIDKNHFKLPGTEGDHQRLIDDESKADRHVQLFKYVEGKSPDFSEWCKLFLGVHGQNGKMALGYYLASLFRSLLYPSRTKEFPILNLFGPPRKGKSTMGWSLISMFGEPRLPLMLSSFTPAAFAARMEQTRDCMAWLEEYKNSMEEWKHQLIKGISDGFGRDRRASKENTKSTETTEILNGVLLSGQDLPTRDIALLTRCITLSFYGFDKSEEANQRFNQLRAFEMSGVLSQITSQLQQFRRLVDERYDMVFEELRSETKWQVGFDPDDRILNAHVIPVAIVRILSEKLDFPQSGDSPFWVELQGFAVELIRQQHKNIEQEDETGDFWRRFASMSNRHELRHDLNFIVSEEDAVRIAVPNTKADTTEHVFEGGLRKVIFLHIDTCHSSYEQDCRKSGKFGLSLASLVTYLEQSKAYVGKVRGKKFDKNRRTLQALVFDMELLAETLHIDMPLTKLVMAGELNQQ